MKTDFEKFGTPGAFILHLMESRGWNQKQLAVLLSIDGASLSRIISAKHRRRITHSMSLRLSDIFGVPYQRFTDLQKAHIESLADPQADPP